MADPSDAHVIPPGMDHVDSHASLEAQRAKSAIRERLFGVRPQPIRVGRFEILDRLGEGAMGTVYRARDPELRRDVALKRLHARGVTAHATRELGARLVREARAMARLNHPNTIAVYEIGELDGEPYIAMEYVRGETLSAWLDREQRSVAAMVGMFEQAGRGLAAAHQAGLVHRDFKPDNVLVGEDGRARVTDFGLVRAYDDRADDRTAARSGSLGGPIALTRHGRLGTPRYMSPEQHRGNSADARADQFSYCVALYEALEREPPFSGTSVAELAAAVTGHQLRPFSRAPRRLRRVLERGLRPHPEQRYRDMSALLHALRGRSRMPARLGWLAAVVAIGVVASWSIRDQIARSPTMDSAVAVPAHPGDDAAPASSRGITRARETGQTPPRSAPDACRGSESCTRFGRCRTGRTGECEATSDDDCRAAEICTHDGQCSARGGECKAARDSDCLGSRVCEWFGHCHSNGRLCVK